MLALVTLCLCFGTQEPEREPTEPPKAEIVDAAATKSLTDEEAKAALAAFKDAPRGPKVSLAERTAAVEALGRGSHASLIGPLAKVVASESALSVQRTAAQALGRQPAAKARGVLLKLIDDNAIQQKPMLVADLVTSLDTAGYESRDWKQLERMFAADFAEEHAPKQKAILVLAKNQQETEALDLLLEHLDEPAPADPNSPSNPPASYWEARWKAWRAWRDDVKAALFAITGQRFNTSAEAREWLKKNQTELRKRKRR